MIVGKEMVVVAESIMLEKAKDFAIQMKQMCGDSEVEEVSYEVYKADDQYMLDEKRLIELLKKYNSYDGNLNSITQ